MQKLARMGKKPHDFLCSELKTLAVVGNLKETSVCYLVFKKEGGHMVISIRLAPTSLTM